MKLPRGSTLNWLVLFTLIFLLFSCAHDKCKNFNVLNHSSNPEFSIENYHKLKEKYNKPDNVLRLYKPLIFAHRGGALEAPESTLMAFKYAKEEAGADVLELDVQLTSDGEFVVWHGPYFHNVYIEKSTVCPNDESPDRRKISEFKWCELKDHAWVADPCKKPDQSLKEDDNRKLLLLSDFLSLNDFKDMPLNIEMKGSFENKTEKSTGLDDNIDRFLNILNQHKGTRKIIIASRHTKILKKFRDKAKGAFITNLSLGEQMGLVHGNILLKNRVLETSYFPLFSTSLIVDKVRKSGSSTYVFLTGFGPIPSIDIEPDETAIINVLERGVDGIMTDKPKRIREIVEEWLKMKLAPEM
jgi:glycerophosphoryl diester phosphodiesterase